MRRGPLGNAPRPAVNARAAHAGRAALAVALAGLWATLAWAVTPAKRHAQTPEAFGLSHEEITFAAADSTRLAGWWFAGIDSASVVVVASRGGGTMADQLPAVREFQQRGFSVLSFDYRDFGPQSSGPNDSLRYIVFASRWVDDMVGALKAARERSRPGVRVFAWGQDLGSAVTLSASARAAGLCDAMAIEGVFRTSQEALIQNGTSQIADVPRLQKRMVLPTDEPLSASVRLRTPLLVVLASKDVLTPQAGTEQVVQRCHAGVRRWMVPGGGHDGLERTPGYFDRVCDWFREVEGTAP